MSTPAAPTSTAASAAGVAKVIFQVLQGGNLILASIPIAMEFAMELHKIFHLQPDLQTNIVNLADDADAANAAAIQMIADWQKAHGFPVTTPVPAIPGDAPPATGIGS